MKRKGYIRPWIFGVVAGCLFVFSEAFLKLYPPAAYSFCLACHTRDLVNGAVNFLFKTNFQIAVIAHRVLMVSSPAVLVGAFISARFNGEHSPQRSERPLIHLFAGFVVMVAGIVIFGCPTRLTIRAAYGDVYGLVAIAGMFLGIWCGTIIIRLRSERGLIQ